MSRRPGGPARLLVIALALAIAAACAGSRDLTVRTTPELAVVRHRRLAVLPVRRDPRGVAPEGAEEILTGQLYAAFDATRRFDLSAPDTVADTLRALGGDGSAAAAGRVGERLGVDLVLVGVLSQFVERVGGDYGVESPASVAFAVGVLEAGSGRQVWHGEFVEEQKPLLTDLGGVGTFLQRGGRWLTVTELSDQGARKVAAALEAAWFEGKSTAATSIPNAAATAA